jgi:MinD-like ATPase involved in chromosome partitioning or flagellar assembly
VTVILLASAKGSPGVTTTALAMASVWPRPVVLAECDPAGGDILAGFLRAAATPTGGLLDVALAARRGLTPDDVVRRCVRLADGGGVLLLTGLTDPGHVSTVVPSWPRIASVFRDLGSAEPPYDVLADCGRLGAPWPTDLVAVADSVVLVLRPTLPQVHSAKHQLAQIRRVREDPAGEIGLLLVGDVPYRGAEVAAALEAPVLGVVAHDPRAAEALSNGSARGRWFDRSALVRSVNQLATILAGRPATEAVS